MKAFQLKMMIKNSHPPIWRRVVVPAGITFSQLSMILNKVMGWSGYHLFEFEFYHLQLRLMEDCEDQAASFSEWDYQEARTTYIREYLEQNGWFSYVYDMGDFWEHRVTVETVLEDYAFDYPQVLKYKGDCPPEDCGGIWGYERFLDAAADPNHPEHEELTAWGEMQGWPDEYDMESVNDELRAMFCYKWGKGENRRQADLYRDLHGGIFGLKATKNDGNKGGKMERSEIHKQDEAFKRFEEMLRQKQLWEDMVKETKLSDIFEDFTKQDIVDIAKDKGLKRISSYNKEMLIQKLTAHMLEPEEIRRYFLCLTDRETRALEKTMKAPGTYRGEDAEELLTLYEAAYIGMFGVDEFIVPAEVKQLYQRMNDEAFRRQRRRRSFVFVCLKAAGMLYGIVPVEVLLKLVQTEPKISLTKEELLKEIEEIPGDISHVVLKGETVYLANLYPDDAGLLAAQGNKAFYIPTKQEILELGIDGERGSEPHVEQLVRFLYEKMGADEADAEYAGAMIQSQIQAGCRMQDISDLLDSLGIQARSKKQLEALMERIRDLWNNTRMMVNRGYTPNELAQMARGAGNPGGGQKDVPASGEAGSAKILSFENARKAKIYPNDPCPCGSGKKYKNCCRNKQ